jgi:hypothetical protein
MGNTAIEIKMALDISTVDRFFETLARLRRRPQVQVTMITKLKTFSTLEKPHVFNLNHLNSSYA